MLFQKGSIPWNKGKKQSVHICKKLKSAWIKRKEKGLGLGYWLGKKRPEMLGKKNLEWKGDNVGYVALHSWVRRKLGNPSICENINCIYPRMVGKVFMIAPKRFEWANKNHKYRRNKTDWISLCPSCHRIYDSNLKS